MCGMEEREESKRWRAVRGAQEPGEVGEEKAGVDEDEEEGGSNSLRIHVRMLTDADIPVTEEAGAEEDGAGVWAGKAGEEVEGTCEEREEWEAWEALVAGETWQGLEAGKTKQAEQAEAREKDAAEEEEAVEVAEEAEGDEETGGLSPDFHIRMRAATQVPYLCLGDGSAGVGENAGADAGADTGVDAGVQSNPQAYDAHAYDKISVFDVTALDPLQSDLRERADQLEAEYFPLCFAWFFLALSWIPPVGCVSLCLNFDAPRGSRLCLAWIAFTVSLLVVLFNVVFWSLFYVLK
ncbi:hypothetical protein B484DRAFT_54255 [Ochromonadaceae sp. CCMP2298]|nr:hypothetical protein B484DRAFT_54255 [Ochromonadaceae sp. CCMP2298]